MAGAAVTIGLQQLKGLLNITNFTTSTDFISVMKSVFGKIDEVSDWVLIVKGFDLLYPSMQYLIPSADRIRPLSFFGMKWIMHWALAMIIH